MLKIFYEFIFIYRGYISIINSTRMTTSKAVWNHRMSKKERVNKVNKKSKWTNRQMSYLEQMFSDHNKQSNKEKVHKKIMKPYLLYTIFKKKSFTS